MVRADRSLTSADENSYNSVKPEDSSLIDGYLDQLAIQAPRLIAPQKMAYLH